MNTIKLITTGIILIFLASGFVQAAENCTKMEAAFSWTAAVEEIKSNIMVTSSDIGKDMPGCSMFKVNEFSSSKLVVGYKLDEKITAVITAGDKDKKPMYKDEWGPNTICDLKLVNFDGNTRSATFGVPESVEKIQNKTITNSDIGIEFEIVSCLMRAKEFDAKSGRLIVELDTKCSGGSYHGGWMRKEINYSDVGKEAIFECCKWTLIKFGCAAEEIKKTVQNNSIQNNSIQNNSNAETKQEEKPAPPETSGDVKNTGETQNTGEEAEVKSQTEEQENFGIEQNGNLKNIENTGLCNGINAAGLCIPVFAAVAVMIILILVLVFLIFNLVRK